MAYKLIVFDWNGTLSKTRLDSQASYELFPGVPELIETLHSKGILLAIATMHSKKGLQRELDFHNLGSYFIETWTADDYPSKPNPKLLEECIAQLGLSLSHVLMVGDAPVDLQYARAAGVNMVFVHTNPQGDHAYSSSKEVLIIKNIIDLLFFI